MKVCIYGFSTMDYKGEETNEIFFVSKLIEELENNGANVYYLYNKSSKIGLNNEEVYNLFNISATRLAIDKYTNFSNGEYKNYAEEELESAIEFNIQLEQILSKTNKKQLVLHKCIKFLENIKEYDNIYNFDCFIFWGNSLVSNVLRMYCKKNNKKFYNLENGYFRPFTLMMDSQGVNFESSLPRDKHFYENIIVDEKKFSSFLHKPMYAKENIDEVIDYREKYYDYYGFKFADKMPLEKKQTECSGLDIYKSEYIYVPFQLETDSQIIKHSQRIKSMLELVDFTVKGVREYNLKYNKNLKVIYKEHPLYLSEIGVSNREMIKSLLSNYNEAIYLTAGDNKQLIANAKAVITINSTVGIEALSLFKPVITLGDCFYNIEDIVFQHNFANNLALTINAALSHTINEDLIKKFLYYLRFEYFKEIYKLYPDQSSIKNLVVGLCGNKSN